LPPNPLSGFDPAHDTTVPVRVLSRYELLEEIGRGNMGIVYRARDPAMDRIVAIKVVRLGFSLDETQRRVFLERFRREAQIAAKLNHPHIVAVHDFGAGEEPFLVMEHFSGVSLARLAENGPLPVAEVEFIARGLASALAYAHARGVVHRDLKPANVLYRAGAIKLVDFGIARLETSELTATGEFIGTPCYMSPEIFSGAPVDGRSDLFSLGVVLYQLLTGRKAFEGGSISRTIYRVLHEQPEPPSSLRPDVPRRWDLVLGKLLAKDPEGRYASAELLLEDLAREEDATAAMRGARRSRARVLPWLALAAGMILLLGIGLRLSVPSDPEETREVAPEVSTPDPPLAFVARHDHAIGHCTGDLSLAETGISFRSSRHGEWRWRPEEVQEFSRPSETELELRARSRERGKQAETETFRFSFLRPALARGDFQRYRNRLRNVRNEE
jgi:serine/threonine protein kinase